MEWLNSLKEGNTSEARRYLRERFHRYLSSPLAASSINSHKENLSDEAMLLLLHDLVIDSEADLSRARTRYESEIQTDECTFNELLAEGWIQEEWGRVDISREVADAVLSAGDFMPALVKLLNRRFEKSYQFSQAAVSDAQLQPLIAQIQKGALRFSDVACLSPGWVAARLWERAGTDTRAALKIWADQRSLLGASVLIPKQSWTEHHANAFREAVLVTVRDNVARDDWGAFRHHFVQQQYLVSLPAKPLYQSESGPANNPVQFTITMIPTQYQSFEDADRCTPALPDALIDRVLWIQHLNPRLWGEQFINDCWPGHMGDLIWLVLSELENMSYHEQAKTDATVSQLIALAIDRPRVLMSLLPPPTAEINSHPLLLVELLFRPETCALACLQIANQPALTIGQDLRVAQLTMQSVFQDAVAVLGHHLHQPSMPIAEVASLLQWMHQFAHEGGEEHASHRAILLDTLHEMLSDQPTATLQAITKILCDALPEAGLNTRESVALFSSILLLAKCEEVAGNIDPTSVITAYAQTIESGHAFPTFHSSIDGSNAATLYRLATGNPALTSKFLYPLDVKAKLQNASQNERIHMNYSLVQSIRTHICILARAMVEWGAVVPCEMVEALAKFIRAGALDHQDRGRIAVFRPGDDAFSRGAPPLAIELGVAFKVLNKEQLQTLLLAILETDEPDLLAKLLAFIPDSRIDQQIKDRIGQLINDGDAAELWSLSDVHNRIDTFLNSKLPEAAEQAIKQEAAFETMGIMSGRTIRQLQFQLRLCILKNEWDQVRKVKIPDELSDFDRNGAQDTLAYYQGVAELLNPTGDRERAAKIFDDLHIRHPGEFAYVANGFIAQLYVLLGDNQFRLLAGPDLEAGKILLKAVKQKIQVMAVSSSPDHVILLVNQALLYLAIEQPRKAYDLLNPLSIQDSHISAYLAVALARMGRGEEAHTVLTQATKVFGPVEVLGAAQQHIQTHAPYVGQPLAKQDIDSVRRIKTALHDLRSLDASQQAEVWHDQPGSFEAYITTQVREATACVTSLVPMMNVVDFTKSEDNLTALICKLLESRLHILGWSILDQSKGGFTAKENPGERDIVLKRESTELAVIEGVVSKDMNRPDLTRHFQKLLAYSSCTLFFHLTYAYNNRVANILAHLKEDSETQAPVGFRYIRRVGIPCTDGRPAGFYAIYRTDTCEVRVVFLVLDLGQKAQKDAAKKGAR